MTLNFVILAICMSLLGNYFWIDEAVDVQKLSKKEQRRLKKKVVMVIFSNLTSPCMYWIELESFHHLQLVLRFMTIELVARWLTEELVMWSEPPLSNNSEKNNWDAFTFSLQGMCISQGAKKVIFTAFHSGKLKLTFTSPNIISTSPKNVLMSRLISQFFCNLNSSKKFTCPLGKLTTEFTSPIAKSTSPGLLDTTFFARWLPVVHVGEELNSWEVLLVLFFPLFPMKVTVGHSPCTCSQGKSLALGPWWQPWIG